MKMTCRQFQECLNQALERRATLNAEMQTHAAECPECARLRDDHQLLIAAVGQWRSRPQDVDLADRVLAAMSSMTANGTETESASASTIVARPAPESERSGAEPRRSNFWASVVTVVLLLIATVLVFRDRPQNVARQDESLPNRKQLNPVPSPVVEDQNKQVADIRMLLSDTGSAWFGFAQRAVERAEDFSVFVPSLTDDFDSAPRSNGATQQTGPQRENRLAPHSLKPTVPEEDQTDDTPPGKLRRALDFLFETAESLDA